MTKEFKIPQPEYVLTDREVEEGLTEEGGISVENKNKEEVKRYNLKIGETSLDHCIKDLNDALEGDRGMNIESIRYLRRRLEESRTERQILLERVLGNPDTIFQDYGNMPISREKLEESIAKIDEALERSAVDNKDAEENVEVKSYTEDEDKTEFVSNNQPKPEQKETKEYRPVVNEINAYFSKWNEVNEKGDESEIEKLRAEINAFILENDAIAQQESERVKNKRKSKAYRVVRGDIKDLKELHSRVNPDTKPEKKDDGQEASVEVEYDSIADAISTYLEKLKTGRTLELEAEILEYISQNENKIRPLIAGIHINDRNEDNESFKKLEKDLKDLHNLKKEVAKKEKKVDKVKYDHINLSEELSLESIAVLGMNNKLFYKLKKAVDEYNEHLTDDESTVAEYFQKIEDLKSELQEYREKILSGKSDVEDETKKKEPEDEIDIEDDKNTDTTEPQPPEEETQPEPESDENTFTPLNQSEIFVIEEGRDYGEMIKDKGFDNWLSEVYLSMLRHNEADERSPADIEFWYEIYRASKPYFEKLNNILEDIEKSSNKIKILMSKDKIGDLFYDMCKDPYLVRSKIDAIFESYEQTKEKEAEIARFRKMEDLKTAISNRADGGELKDEDVRSILETNQENREEVIANMRSFLQDTYNNYDFYNSDSKSETDPNNIYYTFRKWKAGKSEYGRPLGWWSKMKIKLFASFPQELQPEELNNFETLIKELRRLDLVDRKSGGAERSIANKTRLVEIIEFIGNGVPPESDLDDEGKRKLKIFNDLYKVFTNIKHKSNAAKQAAKRILDDNTLDTSITGLTTRPVQDLLFETDSEIKIFEDNARYQINKVLLEELEIEINTFPKARNPEKLRQMMSRFTEIESVLTELGNDTEDKLALEKVNLKLHELIIRDTKRDNYEELSASFRTYERILGSDTITKEKKKKYLEELIDSLIKHRNNRTNTLLQNITLDAIIKRYQGELTSIK